MIQNPFHGGNNNNNGGGGGENVENSNNIPRNPEVNMKSTPLVSAVQRSNHPIPTPTPTPIVNRGTTHIFYKTRMCQKFLEGNCRNGDNCTFAHGSNDLREPPPNWQELVKDHPSNNNRGGGGGGNGGGNNSNWNEDQKIIHRMRICRKFYNTGECPYGERCNFLHESPSKFKADSAMPMMDMERTRETSVINIQTMVDRSQTDAVHVLHGNNNNNTDAVQVNTNASADHSEVLRTSMKATYFKTRMCSKWETTGQCVFGDKCHFAHGPAELNTPVGRVEGGDGGFTIAAPKKPFTGPIVSETSSSVATSSAAANAPGVVKQWKIAHKKLNRIYADWIDDDEDEQNKAD